MNVSSAVKCRRPFKVRVVNFIGPRLASLGMGRIDLSADALEQRARTLTGLSEFGGEDYRFGLEKFVEYPHKDGRLHHLGRIVMRDLLTARLATRLKLRQLLCERPELAKKSWGGPQTFVAGMARSGTTLLYNLMAMDPAFRSPELWETVDPLPPASIVTEVEVEQRIEKFQKILVPYNKMVPEIRARHSIHSARQVEECHGLLEPTFRAASFHFVYWNGPTYFRWLMRQPMFSMVDAVREYATVQNMLMHGHEMKRWFSKIPVEVQFLPAWAEVFPEARIIHTRRDPKEQIPSWCSTMQAYQSMYADPSPQETGRQALDYHDLAMKGMAAARKGPTGKNTLDVEYQVLVRDPIATVGKVYDFLGQQLTADHESRMADWLKSKNPYDRERAGHHNYDAASFGVSKEELARLAS